MSGVFGIEESIADLAKITQELNGSRKIDKQTLFSAAKKSEDLLRRLHDLSMVKQDIASRFSAFEKRMFSV